MEDYVHLIWCLRQAHKYLAFAQIYLDDDRMDEELLELRIKVHEQLEIAENLYIEQKRKRP